MDAFEDTPLLSPHNLAFVMGDVESLGKAKAGPDNGTATFWGDPKRRSRGMYLVDKLERIVALLSDMFSMPYPLPKLDIVALPPRIVDDTGSPGLITLRYRSISIWSSGKPSLLAELELWHVLTLAREV